MAQNESWTSWIEMGAAVVTAITGVVALWGVAIEYRRQKERERVQLAQEMIGYLSTDELLFFAVTVLDWGTGLIVVPTMWQKVIPEGHVKWDYKDIRDAMTPIISDATRENPVRLLYRQAFVHLFDHLERIANLVGDSAVEVSDLRSLAWLARSLTNWKYAPPHERTTIFMEPLAAWYDSPLIKDLLADINQQFPKLPAPAKSTTPIPAS